MTKAEVIAAAGKPKSVSAMNGIEYLNYRLATSPWDTDGSDTSDYFVQIIEGKVTAYGQKGDFEMHQAQKKRLQIEVIQKKE